VRFFVINIDVYIIVFHIAIIAISCCWAPPKLLARLAQTDNDCVVNIILIKYYYREELINILNLFVLVTILIHHWYPCYN